MEDKISKLEKENMELRSNISKLNSRLLCLENIVGICIFVDMFLLCLQFIFK
jgi:hypothetical protein